MFLACFCSSTVFGDTRIVGKCERPFPAIMPLDYTRCRAAAWLDALGQAQKLLPPVAGSRLWEMDAEDPLSRLALAALVFSVETATPDISSSPVIQVFLRLPENMADKVVLELADPEKLLVTMCFLTETRHAITVMDELWPDSVTGTDAGLLELEKYARALAGLWDAAQGVAGMNKFSLQAAGEDFASAATLAPESVPLLLAASSRNLENGLPGKALEMAGRALALCDSPVYSHVPHFLGEFLRGYSRYQLGMAHWRQDQPALAESDFKQAASMLGENEMLLALHVRDLMALGNLLQARGEREGMCAAFQKACALGSCGGLAEARRHGACMDMEP